MFYSMPGMPVKPRPEGLDRPVVPRIIRVMSRVNVWLYQRTGGRLGNTWRVGAAFPRGVPVCLLTTTGRKSGEPRTTPLLFIEDGGAVVVVGSYGGLPHTPQWVKNLEADPRARLQIGRTIREVSGRIATPETRARLWPKLVAHYADFASYQSWTEREIPVILLEPV